MITSINGVAENSVVRDFVDNGFLAKDARAFREYINKIQPDVALEYTLQYINKDKK